MKPGRFYLCQDRLEKSPLSAVRPLSGLVGAFGGGGHRGGKASVELAGDVALQAAPDLASGLALGSAAGNGGPCGGAAAHAGVGDGVNGAVELAVSASVQPVAHGAPAGGFQRAGAREGRECGVVAAPPDVGERRDGLSGADRANTGAVKQPGSEVVDDGLHLGSVGLEGTSGFPQRQSEPADLALAHSLFSAGVTGLTASSKCAQGGVGQLATRDTAVGVIS